MTLRRRLERLEDRAPDPDARRPQFPTLWDGEEPPEDLPPGSVVARVAWGRLEEEEGGAGATETGGRET